MAGARAATHGAPPRLDYDVARMHVRRSLAALVLTVMAAGPATAQNAPDQAPPAGPTEPAQPSPRFERDPFVYLIHNTLHDLKAFASLDTALTLGVGGGLSAASHPADDWVTDRATSPTTRFFDIGGNSGSGYIHIGGAVATYAAGRLAGSPRTAHIGSDLIRAQVLTGIVTHGLKAAVRRQRPGRTDGSSFSFPSGHTSSAWATTTVLWRHFGWKAGVPAAAVGAWVASGRVQQREHFFSDVIFGAAVGMAGGRTVTIGHGARAVTLRPSPVPGGMAVLFTPARR